MTTIGHAGPTDSRFEQRYRAVASRDGRFDGQFITGVRTTGIYCRPSCPATTPLRANVVFFRTAAAAHEAGLRACKRCLPDAVPGSPEWNLGDDLASRAMRLIADGVVERDGVPGLAARLGYTPRHLTRVLTRELGAGPLALARAHRAQTARQLLTATDLPIADVAFAAGFASVRQFNDTIGAVYERTPSALRASRRADDNRADDVGADHVGARDLGAAPATSGSEGTSLRLRLPARPPFDGAGLLRFFADHAIVGVEEGDADHYRRLVRLPHGVGEIDVRLDGADGVVCAARVANIADISTLASRVRRLFDLDADSEAIDGALRDDPALATSVAAHPGVRLPGSLDADETLFRTLLGQQVSVKAATTVLGRVSAELTGGTGLFPTAEHFAARGAEVLRGPARRVAAIIGVAEAVASGRVSLDVGMPVHDLTAQLVALPGVGPWTAGYVAMRVLGAPDVLLSSDLIMLQSARSLGLPGTDRALAEHGTRWAPWRSYAGLHLWRSANR